jgi:hypothetical protein
MAFQEVGGAKRYVKYSECQAGDELVEGYYTGTTVGKYGNQYNFLTEDGKQVVLNKSGQLEYAIKFVEVGEYVKVIYEGVAVLQKGTFKGKEAHNFKVLKDPERRRRTGGPIPAVSINDASEVLDSENPLA